MENEAKPKLHSPTLTSLHLRHSTALPLLHLCHRHFTYVTAHSPTLPPLYLHHSSFYNPSIASPTSQIILQTFCHFIYATAHSITLPPLHLRHRSFYNSYVASPTSQVLHVLHLTSRPCIGDEKTVCGGLACYGKLVSLEVATVLDSC